jgi:hypothetical protein
MCINILDIILLIRYNPSASPPEWSGARESPPGPGPFLTITLCPITNDVTWENRPSSAPPRCQIQPSAAPRAPLTASSCDPRVPSAILVLYASVEEYCRDR